MIGMAVWTSGCAALLIGAAAGAGSVAYLRGELRSIEKASVDRTYSASLGALEKLEIFTTKKSKDKTTAQIIARRADDKKVTIRIKSLGDELVSLRIRVGMLGDEGTSRQILTEIKARL